MEGLLEPSIEAQASQLSWVLQVWQFEGHSLQSPSGVAKSPGPQA
jgi:hypothetical protein